MTRAGTQRGIPSWRLLVILALSLLLGIVTTHLVAWHFAWHAGGKGVPSGRIGFGVLMTSNEPMLHVVNWDGRCYSAVQVVRGAWNAEATTWLGEMLATNEELPAWCTLSRVSGDGIPRPLAAAGNPDGSAIWTEYAAGWPWRSHRWIRRGDEFFGAWSDLGKFEEVRPRGAEGALPYLVWWPGLLGDTLLYAAPWPVLLLIPYWVRGRVRRHYGHCPRCGYDLQRNLSQGCHECGWGRGDQAGDTKTPP